MNGYKKKGYKKYKNCKTILEKSTIKSPDNITAKQREEWWEGWLQAAAEDTENDEVNLL